MNKHFFVVLTLLSAATRFSYTAHAQNSPPELTAVRLMSLLESQTYQGYKDYVIAVQRKLNAPLEEEDGWKELKKAFKFTDEKGSNILHSLFRLERSESFLKDLKDKHALEIGPLLVNETMRVLQITGSNFFLRLALAENEAGQSPLDLALLSMKQTEPFAPSAQEEQKVLDLLTENPAISADELAEKTGLSKDRILKITAETYLKPGVSSPAYTALKTAFFSYNHNLRIGVQTFVLSVMPAVFGTMLFYTSDSAVFALSGLSLLTFAGYHCSRSFMNAKNAVKLRRGLTEL